MRRPAVRKFGNVATRSRVAVLGLGNMGAALARALLNHGHDVVVWNRTPGRASPLVTEGAVLAASSHEAIAASPVTIMCVLNYGAATEILNSDKVARELVGKTLVQLTSAMPDEVSAQSEWVHGCGGTFLAGGIMVFPSGIGRPDTVIVYSGDRAAFDDRREVLLSLGGSLRYLGEDPRIAVAAYCTAGIYALGSVGLFLESATLARHYGIPIDTYYGLARLSSDLVFDRLRDSAHRVATNCYDGDEAAVDMILAALRDFCTEFSRTGIPARMTEAFTAQLEFASAGGSGDKDIAVLANALWAARRPVARGGESEAG